MDLGLKGKVGLVAAASKGMGRAIALAFAREGMNVALSARGKNALDETAREAAALGAKVAAVPADMAKAEDVMRFVQSAEDAFGRIDVLVTNAGGPPVRSFEQLDDEDWAKAFDLNLMSTVRLIRAALPYLEQQGGSVITITSISVKQPVSGLILSNSIRPGVIGLAKTLADDLGRRNIRFNNILPGMIMTERARDLAQKRADSEGVTIDEIVARTEAAIPLRRYGRPEEVADLAVFLASNASSYLTGTSILVDGGLYRGLY